MSFEHRKHDAEAHEALRVFDGLRRFDGSPPDFWAEYMEACRRLVGGAYARLMVMETGQTSWKTMGVWPPARRRDANQPEAEAESVRVADATSDQGLLVTDRALGGTVIGLRLDAGEAAARAVALVYVDRFEDGLNADEAGVRLSLVADVPLLYQMRKQADKARNDVIRFAETLDLMVLLNAEERYRAAVMTFVNEMAARFRCSRVSLGWQIGDYVRIQGISHMEQFEKKMEAVQGLEAAMEETLDQDEEILLPPPEGQSAVVRAHGAFAESHGGRYLLSLPIRPGDKPKAVLMCERDKEPFSDNEIQGLRLFCDQATRRLDDLRVNDVWFGRRMARTARKKLSGLLGVEHTFAKVLAIVGFFLLAFLLFGRLEYRVEAPFILKTDDVAYLPSPFEGYIKTVHVQVGDEVAAGQPLLSLDTRELLIEESAAIADKSRYQRESEKSRARYALAEMKIAQALREQAEAKLELIRHHLGNADIRAPFAGIVVEGDLREMLGAPVRKGDVLFKVARIENLYAELDVDERDIHDIHGQQTGQIAFVSRPEFSYPIAVERIDPVALSRDEGNVFPVRCRLESDLESWWRPGMSGISKINAGRRNVLWIITHRTVDFLRLFFWW